MAETESGFDCGVFRERGVFAGPFDPEKEKATLMECTGDPQVHSKTAHLPNTESFDNLGPRCSLNNREMCHESFKPQLSVSVKLVLW